MEQFAPIGEGGVPELIREAVQKPALIGRSPRYSQVYETEMESGEAIEQVETTRRKIEGYFIVKAIVREVD